MTIMTPLQKSGLYQVIFPVKPSLNPSPPQKKQKKNSAPFQLKPNFLEFLNRRVPEPESMTQVRGRIGQENSETRNPQKTKVVFIGNRLK